MKCAYPVRRGFDSVDVEVPNFCIEDFGIVMERIREEAFEQLRRRFQRVMREWPMCPLHGLVLLFPTYAITAAGRLMTVLAYGCGGQEPTAEQLDRMGRRTSMEPAFFLSR